MIHVYRVCIYIDYLNERSESVTGHGYIAPCVLSASSHIILSSRARHSTRVTRSSPVQFHLTRNTTDRRWIRRGYTVFRFRRNGFKDPSVYRREPLSLRSEPPPRRARLTPLRSRRILFIYIYITAVPPHRTHRCTRSPFCFLYVRKSRRAFEESLREEFWRRLLKEAGLKRCYSQRRLPSRV